jgi:hypothetical protein
MDANSLIIDNTIQNNTLDGQNESGGGISILGTGYIEITANQIVNNHLTRSAGGSAISINTGTTPDQIWLDRNWIARNNDASGSAVKISYSQHISLTNNLIVQNYDTGLMLLNNSGVITSTNNTFDHNLHNGITVVDSDIRLVNTIVTYSSHYGIEVTGTTTVHNYRNDFWGNAAGVSNQPLSVMEADPLYMDMDHSLYGLRAGSPCRDSGYTVDIPPSSYNGLSRPQGSGVDIGAYEMPEPVFLPIILH